MKGLRRLERATTDYLVPTSIGVVVAAVAGFWWLVARHLVSVDTLAKFVDIAAKSIAVSIGALWALTRAEFSFRNSINTWSSMPSG
jgi:hypothetical protein